MRASPTTRTSSPPSATSAREQAGLVTCRLPAERRIAIARLQAIGFRYVETVQTLRFANLARFEPPCRPAPLRLAAAEDHAALLTQAAETFHYGRFAEDPAIPPEVNRRRQVDWMEGLLAGRATVLVTGASPRPGAFMAFTTADGSADLVLGGTQPDQAVLALPFWTAILLHLKEQGSAASTRWSRPPISASPISMRASASS